MDENDLKDKDDWMWHVRRLDAARKYHHVHAGEPERYPCRV
jgi:hypothetical protein